ncbi:uncharacterized protein LOC120335235 isoform X1 [Styela clava]
MSSKTQLTLALLKPDIALNPIATKAVTDRISKNNLRILRKKTVHWKRKDAEIFYNQHSERFFYERLLDYITCGPVIALVLAGQDSIKVWRSLMGPTKVFKANISEPYSLRGEYGLTDTRNSTHGSDSEESANREIEIIFGENTVDIASTKEYNTNTQFHWDKNSINSSLGLLDTWNQFYRTTKPNPDFEWFANYDDLKDSILPMIRTALSAQDNPGNRKPYLLDIGCGDSTFGANIAYDLKDVEVYCLDFAIDSLWRLQNKMDGNSKFDNVRNCTLVHANIAEQQVFSTGSICAALDKGTTDSILKQPKGTELASRALANIYKILCKDGVLIQVTDEPPELRIDLLQEAAKRLPDDITSNISISCQQFTSVRDYFLYTVSKS